MMASSFIVTVCVSEPTDGRSADVLTTAQHAGASASAQSICLSIGLNQRPAGQLSASLASGDVVVDVVAALLAASAGPHTASA